MSNPAIDAALNIARAKGGSIPHPYVTPMPHPKSLHVGPIRAAVAGRTDHIPMKVPANSYVLPADVVSGAGEGNTEAGHHIVDGIFKHHPGKFSSGGDVGGDDEGIDIIAAGGEHVLSPSQVAFAGDGDLKQGHETLDHWVKMMRKNNIKTLQKLPGPAKGDE